MQTHFEVMALLKDAKFLELFKRISVLISWCLFCKAVFFNENSVKN